MGLARYEKVSIYILLDIYIHMTQLFDSNECHFLLCNSAVDAARKFELLFYLFVSNISAVLKGLFPVRTEFGTGIFSAKREYFASKIRYSVQKFMTDFYG